MKKVPTFDFTGKLRIPLIISGCIFVVGFALNFILGPELDINFKGGVMLSYSYTGEVDPDAVLPVAEEIAGDDVKVTESSDFTGTKKNIVINLSTEKTLSTEKQKLMLAKLQEKFPDNDIKLSDSNSVSATVGIRFFLKSLWTIALAGIFVTLYVGVRFRKIGGFSAGAMALVALFHDIIIAYLTFVILRIPIDDNFIAVVLTILGYSLNDTIVIYDRIREDRKKLGNRVPLGELVNGAINKTLGRTLNTALATFVAVTAVTVVAYLRGLDSILSFTMPMSIGIISGSYSTIFLAGPLWVKWNEYRRRKKDEKKKKQRAEGKA